MMERQSIRRQFHEHQSSLVCAACCTLVLVGYWEHQHAETGTPQGIQTLHQCACNAGQWRDPYPK